MTEITIDNQYMAATLLCLGFKMVSKGVFEDSPELQEAIKKYQKRGIPVDLHIFSQHLKYIMN